MEIILQSTINSLGYLDGGIYFPEPDCFESIRDLIRFLRYDNSAVLTRRTCGEHNIIQNDLIPIMKNASTADSLFDIALRLAINLTQPTTVVFASHKPEDKEGWLYYMQVEELLRRSKLSFADEYFFRVLKDKLNAYFQKEWDERKEEKKMMVERIFVLIRNALSIDISSMDNQRTTWDINSQDKLVLALLRSGLGTYIIETAVSEAEFRLLIMEIIALVIKQRNPKDVAFTNDSGSAEERAKAEAELKLHVDQSLQKEKLSRMSLSVRHSRFAGSYVVRNVKAINPENYLAFSTRRTFVYNNADIHYFLIEYFFMGFRRVANLPLQQVEATISKESFHHVQVQLDSYLESAQIDRKESRSFCLRAEHAVLAYRELLLTLYSMMKSEDDEQKQEAEAICSHIMEMEEYRDLASSIIRQFSPGLLSKTFLRNLILANHTYFALLERTLKLGKLSTVKKRRKIRRRRKIHHETAPVLDEDDDIMKWDAIWEEISEELSDIVLGHEPATDDINPIDVMLEVEDTVHERFAMLRIQQALRERRVADGVGLYRASRVLWPDDDCFGAKDISAENEFLELRAIYFTDLSNLEEEWNNACKKAYGSEEHHPDGNIFDDEIGNSGEDSDEDEDVDGQYEEKEVEFDFERYLQRFARKDVLRWYVFLLSEYRRNSVELNRALIKMLHRIAFDLKLSSRLFQISLFHILSSVGTYFQKLSSFSTQQDIKADPLYEIYEFGYHLLKRFFIAYQRIGSRIVPEILFWKGPKECYEIDFGYGSYASVKERNDKKKEILWTEELDNELRMLHDEFVNYDEKPEGMDVVEFIEHNLTSSRSRRQIIREMKSLGLDTFGAKTRVGILSLRKSQPASLPSEVLEQIRTMVSEYNAISENERTCDMVEFIRNRLAFDCSRQRLIKQLKYDGVDYKMRKTPKKKKSWPVELVTELRSICEEYKQLEHKSGDLVGYALARLTVKKTRRQIVTKLQEIGEVDIDPAMSREMELSFDPHDSDSFGEDDENNDPDDARELSDLEVMPVHDRAMSESFAGSNSSDEDPGETRSDPYGRQEISSGFGENALLQLPYSDNQSGTSGQQPTAEPQEGSLSSHDAANDDGDNEIFAGRKRLKSASVDGSDDDDEIHIQRRRRRIVLSDSEADD